MSNSPVRRALRAAVQLAASTSLVAALAVTAHAQPPQGGGGGRPNMTAMMFEGITLSAEQQTKVDSISGAFREKMMAMGRPTPGDSTAMAARMKMNAERNAALRGILTADQQKAFDANVAKMPQGRGMGGGRPPAGR